MKRRLIDANDLVHRVLGVRDNVLMGLVRFEHAACNADRFKQAMHGGIRKALHEIETSPTIDAVEVVRCVDCVYGRPHRFDYKEPEIMICINKNMFPMRTSPGFYCAHGERKINAEVEE